MTLIFQVICVFAVFYWLFQALYFLWVWRFIPHFDPTDVALLKEFPKLSVIIPACNEEDTLEEALQSLLRLEYPDLEIILINDRSTDKTGEIIEMLGGKDPRVLILHIAQLPEGWLGKVHALHQGVQKASGDWLLFTDADVHFSRDILERAISYAQVKNVDHLALLPNMSSSNFIVNCAISSCMRGLLMGLKPWNLDDPAKENAIGVGGFNLVKKEIFTKAKGFEWLRMEVADDIGVGYLIKKVGGKTQARFAIDFLRVDWYPSFFTLVRGLEKNAFAQLAQFSLWRGVLISSILGLFLSSFFLVFWLSPFWQGLVWGAFGISALIVSWKFSDNLKLSFFSVFLSFLIGDLIMSWIILRASILGFRRRGLIWRGTVYDAKKLKEGTRIKF